MLSDSVLTVTKAKEQYCTTQVDNLLPPHGSSNLPAETGTGMRRRLHEPCCTASKLAKSLADAPTLPVINLQEYFEGRHAHCAAQIAAYYALDLEVLLKPAGPRRRLT